MPASSPAMWRWCCGGHKGWREEDEGGGKEAHCSLLMLVVVEEAMKELQVESTQLFSKRSGQLGTGRSVEWPFSHLDMCAGGFERMGSTSSSGR